MADAAASKFGISASRPSVKASSKLEKHDSNAFTLASLVFFCPEEEDAN